MRVEESKTQEPDELVSADSTADVSDTEPQHGLVLYHGKSICPEIMEFNFADVSSSFGDDVDLELLDDFLQHYREQTLEPGALDDEGEGELSIDDVYQRAHSVKGAAIQLNMTDIAQTACCLEVISHAMGSHTPFGKPEESDFIRESYSMQELGVAVAVYRSTLQRRIGLLSEWVAKRHKTSP